MSAKGKARPKIPKYLYVTHPLLETPYAISATLSQEIFDSAVNFKPDPTDTFIMSYPKNGTTWLMNIMYLMRSNGVPMSENENWHEVIPFIEFDGAEAVKKRPKPRMIKSHLYFKLTPFRDDVKYVFVARNPKDTVVSFYFHTLGFGKYYDFEDGSFDDFFEVFISGGCDSGDYFTLVPEWIEESRKRDNIHFMLYEDMKNDIKREILKLADFLGCGSREKLERNNGELLSRVIEHSSFKRMNKDSSLFCGAKRPDDMPFVRKGIIGDWKNYFSQDQNRRMEEKMNEVAKKYPGFAQIWSKYDKQLQF